MSHSTKRLNLSKLNAPQRDAVLHTEGPLLILAGAGSGKTSTVTYRIAHLIADRGVKASQILGLSFTNKAARELKSRVTDLVTQVSGASAVKGLTVTTFHSLCARLLREFAPLIGYSAQFSIVDDSDQVEILRKILKDIKIDDRKFDPRALLFEISMAKNQGLRGKAAEAHFLNRPGSFKGKDDYSTALLSAYPRYEAQLKALNAMDFDDLQSRMIELLESHDDVRAKLNERFRYIHVDEYQDTNPVQFRLLELLLEKTQNICVVGDDDQSIYSWRGADPKFILGFDRRYLKARVIVLDQNYRSTKPILDAANEVIAKNSTRRAKTLWTARDGGDPLREVILEADDDETEYVAEELERRARDENRPYGDFAILYRSNAQSRGFEEALRMRRIPYKLVGAMSFLDRKEIKDFLAYLRLILNPNDDLACRRILNWPVRGIGRAALEHLNTAASTSGRSLAETLPDCAAIAPRAAAGASRLYELLSHLRGSLKGTRLDPAALSEWAVAALAQIEFRRGVTEDCDDDKQAASRIENVEELCHALGRMRLDDRGIQSAEDALREFVVSLTLDAQEESRDQEKEKEQSKNQVTLMTLHGAKGLEFPVVFLVGCEEGYLPHKRTIEEAKDFSEERRLCYVGITRAKDTLVLTRVKNRIRYGKPVPRTPSRFLADVPEELLLKEDRSLSPDLSTKAAQDQHEERVKGFLAQIRARL